MQPQHKQQQYVYWIKSSVDINKTRKKNFFFVS